MDRTLKPERFSCLPNSANARNEWKHWFRTFENFIKALNSSPKAPKVNSLECLTNCISASVFIYIEDCPDYKSAIATLTSLYDKKVNPIFARHVLASRKQLQNETIDEFIMNLQLLSRDCNYTAVSAEQHSQEAIRDVFICGISSPEIRQRLLESSNITLNEILGTARCMESAQNNSVIYNILTNNNSTSAAVKSHDEEIESTSAAISNRSGYKCYYCGYNKFHERRSCPARDVLCNKCSRKGHFAKVCKSSNSSSKTTSASTYFNDDNSHTSALLCLSSPSPISLASSIINIKVNQFKFKALIDSGSSSSFINDKLARNCNFSILFSSQSISMASTSKQVTTNGHCVVDVIISGKLYPSLQLTLLPGLCTDVILGQDFMRLHKSVVFKLNGSLETFNICSSVPMTVSAPKLFQHLLPNCKPICTPSRRYNSQDREFILQEINSLLSSGVIEGSTSPWRAQVVVVKNSSHRKRMVIDYSQTINRFTQLDAYPLPLIDELIHNVSQYSVFSVIDLKSAYHQIPLRDDEKVYTAFEANGKLYHFTRIPYGLTNAVAAFQRTMNSIISTNNLSGVFSYLDDIIVAGQDMEQHDKNLSRLLTCFNALNVSLNENKCMWRKSTIKFLGYSISKETVKPDPDRLQPLRDLPIPADLPSLRRVLGLFSYYSKWISKFSDKVIPLTTSSLPLNSDAVKCFQSLKKEIETSALSRIDENIPFVVETDASDHAFAATLNQNGHPVAFFSRKLSEPEKQYPAIEKEACAIVEALRKWRHFLLIRPFTIVTDQQGVSYLFNRSISSKTKNVKIQRWRIELSSFVFDIKYRPGCENRAADALSRVCGAIHSKLTLEQIHTFLCHPGTRRLFHFVRSKNLAHTLEEVKNVCDQCKLCHELKPRFYKPPAQKLIKATRPFERISMDFMGPKTSTTQNHYVLTIIDEFSRFPFAFPCPDMSATTVIRCLRSLFALCGSPECIHSDRGSQFMSDAVKNFLIDNNVAQTRTSPYNPAGNGQCERFNGVIWKAVLLALRSRGLKESQWEIVLPDVLNSQRTLLCTITNSTPHERFFNYQRRSTVGSSLPSWLINAQTVYVKRHVRVNKNDPLVDEATIVQLNPNYAVIRFTNGRESSVSLRDLSPKPQEPQTTQSFDHSEAFNESFDNENVQTQMDLRDSSTSNITERGPNNSPPAMNDKGNDLLRRSARNKRPPKPFDL